MTIIKIPIQQNNPVITTSVDTKEGWSRKKLLVLYFLCMPLIAMLFVYYSTMPDTTIGIISENIGAIVLCGIIYSNLRAYLERRKKI